MLLQTPSAISPKILELCQTLNAQAQPILIRITPDPGCKQGYCFFNVRQKVASEGGRIQTGWAIWEWPRVFIEAEHHAVYEPKDGSLWLDITPSDSDPGDISRLFLPDDTATYDFENEGVSRGRCNVRMTLADDPLVHQYFRLLDDWNAMLIANAVPGRSAARITEADAQRLKEQSDSIKLQLAMKYTPQGAPCFCGSGSKFKRCHGQKQSKVHTKKKLG